MAERKTSDLDLMMYRDGELAEAEIASVEASLREDLESARVVESLNQVGEVVRTYLEVETDEIAERSPAFDSMWSAIERGIHANGVSKSPVERVPAAAKPRGVFAALGEWFAGHRGHFVTGAVAAGCAVALVLVTRPPDTVVERVEVPVNRGSVEIAPVALTSEPPEVENLEVYEGSGMVFTIPGENDDSSATVIWISKEETTVEGPI